MKFVALCGQEFGQIRDWVKHVGWHEGPILKQAAMKEAEVKEATE